MATQENNQIVQPPLVKQIAEIVLNVDSLRIPADVLLKTKTLILDAHRLRVGGAARTGLRARA